jgi:two-component system, NarL family, response regulator DevR
LILTSYDDDEALFAAMMSRASGCLLRQIGGNSLVEGIRQVAAGRSLLDPAVTEKLLNRLRNPVEPDPLASTRTTREREILDLIADGAPIGRSVNGCSWQRRPQRTMYLAAGKAARPFGEGVARASDSGVLNVP